jgi:hypothetical protein
LSLHCRQLGGTSRNSRRQHVSFDVGLAALPVSPAAHFSGSFHSSLPLIWQPETSDLDSGKLKTLKKLTQFLLKRGKLESSQNGI